MFNVKCENKHLPYVSASKKKKNVGLTVTSLVPSEQLMNWPSSLVKTTQCLLHGRLLWNK